MLAVHEALHKRIIYETRSWYDEARVSVIAALYRARFIISDVSCTARGRGCFQEDCRCQAERATVGGIAVRRVDVEGAEQTAHMYPLSQLQQWWWRVLEMRLDGHEAVFASRLCACSADDGGTRKVPI